MDSPEDRASSLELSPPLLSGDPDLSSEAESINGALPALPPPACFKVMLQSELSVATTKLATHLTKEIKELGGHTSDLKDKMDAAVSHRNLQGPARPEERIGGAMPWLEDFENCYCQGNLHLRDNLETIADLSSTATALFQELVHRPVRV